jgi:hypothetical protein
MNTNENDVKIVLIVCITLIFTLYILVNGNSLERETLFKNGFVYVPMTFSEPAKYVRAEEKK